MQKSHSKRHEIFSIQAIESTITESPYWQQGIIILQEPLDLFGEPLLIVTTGQPVRNTKPAPSLPPDHYGCGLGCNRFTGTLAAVEEHERVMLLSVFFPKDWIAPS